MSSKKAEIKPLQHFGKDWKKEDDEEEKARRVRMERRYPLISLPRELVLRVAKVLKANIRDLEVTYHANPLASEIRLKFRKKPRQPLPHESEKRSSKSKGKQ